MAEYIDREKLIEKLRKDPLFELVERYGITGVIESIPAADVRPVKRGMWTSVFDIGTVCNQCGYDIENHGYDVRTDGEPNFCPNCGAWMGES